jgi:3-hydroxyisobutyrate dehydrogenase
MVRDDNASREVWLNTVNGALQGMRPEAIAIECSTLTPAWILELGEATRTAGISLLEAPVSGSTLQAEKAELVFLAGGEAETVEAARIILKSMGSSIQHAGPLGAGALAKLVTNTLMGVQIATLAEMIGMLRKHPTDPEQVLTAVSATAIWSPHLTRDMESMLAHDFSTRFPVSLLHKDLAYTLQTAGGNSSSPTVAAVLDVFQKAIDKGLGASNMTSVVKLFE